MTSLTIYLKENKEGVWEMPKKSEGIKEPATEAGREALSGARHLAQGVWLAGVATVRAGAWVVRRGREEFEKRKTKMK